MAYEQISYCLDAKDGIYARVDVTAHPCTPDNKYYQNYIYYKYKSKSNSFVKDVTSGCKHDITRKERFKITEKIEWCPSKDYKPETQIKDIVTRQLFNHNYCKIRQRKLRINSELLEHSIFNTYLFEIKLSDEFVYYNKILHYGSSRIDDLLETICNYLANQYSQFKQPYAIHDVVLLYRKVYTKQELRYRFDCDKNFPFYDHGELGSEKNKRFEKLLENFSNHKYGYMEEFVWRNSKIKCYFSKTPQVSYARWRKGKLINAEQGIITKWQQGELVENTHYCLQAHINYIVIEDKKYYCEDDYSVLKGEETTVSYKRHSVITPDWSKLLKKYTIASDDYFLKLFETQVDKEINKIKNRLYLYEDMLTMTYERKVEFFTQHISPAGHSWLGNCEWYLCQDKETNKQNEQAAYIWSKNRKEALQKKLTHNTCPCKDLGWVRIGSGNPGRNKQALLDSLNEGINKTNKRHSNKYKVTEIRQINGRVSYPNVDQIKKQNDDCQGVFEAYFACEQPFTKQD